MRSPLKVLLVSPGCSFQPDGNFGVPHLVALGSWLQSRHGCEVTILDLDYERHLPEPRPQMVFDEDWDLVGISCYSSYEYLKSFYLGVEIRARNPGVCLVVGGYHPSARPADFTTEESPFDHVVIGEGEEPLSLIVDALEQGERLEKQVLGPLMVRELDALPVHDWSLLERYRPYARRIGSQHTFYLSRGCPFRCVFCMEAAMQSTWRVFSVERTELELRRLTEYFDLEDRTLFLTDPLFGVRRGWRREILERIPALELPVEKIWALSRADLLKDEDIELLNRANFGIGCGLESGDVEMLGVIHKGGKPADYLERFMGLADHAARINFPWGANVIAGHPGETVESLQRSAAWIGRMISETRGPTGFLSVDPYRFYPGSPIDINFARYQETYGTHVYRPRWWNYSEQAFCSEWVDASRDLDYRTRTRLTHELFGPIVRDLAERYAYNGRGATYFRRSVDFAVRCTEPRHRIGYLRHYFLWQRLTERGDDDIRDDPEAAALLRDARGTTLEAILASRPELTPSPALRQAIIDEPRERYVDARHVWSSTRDVTLPLGPDTATLSAIHAYLTNYGALALGPGDRLLELGAGTGYGVGVASRVVGPSGRVLAYEFEPSLAERAQALHVERDGVEIRRGSHLDVAPEALADFDAVLFSFALREPPEALLEHLPAGARLVAPIGDAHHQVLWRFTRRPDGALSRERLGEVRYVTDRTASTSASSTSTSASASA